MNLPPSTPHDGDAKPAANPWVTLLRWYVEAGLTDTIAPEAIDRFRLGVETSEALAPPLPPQAERTAEVWTRAPVSPAQSASTPTEAVSAARRIAKAAASLAELKDALADFEGCALKHTATNLVFADGNPEADLVLIGEAPGRDEDLRGLPFVGRSGQLLDRMLAAIGRDRTKAYILNILPWRPPANRNPTPEEMAVCLPFVLRHLELTRAKTFVALGGVAAKQLLDTTSGIMRLRGNWQTLTLPNGVTRPLLPTFHPAYLLRQPAHKKLAWRDLLSLRQKLETQI